MSEDAFGNIVQQTPPPTDPSYVNQPFIYTGREWDAAAGLYYYRARYYDPSIGRFISEDPLGLEGVVFGETTNFYPYVENNPINKVDPLGLKAIVGASCGSAQERARIERLADKAERVGGKCLPEPLATEYKNKFSAGVRIECDGAARCGATYLHEPNNYIWLGAWALDGSGHCGCTQSTILHEVIHLTGRDDDAAYACEVKCFRPPCPSTRPDNRREVCKQCK